MCARKVHPHFTIYHLPCNQNRVRVTSELPRSYLGVVFPHASHGVIFARSWSGKEMFIVNSEKVRIFGYADVFRRDYFLKGAQGLPLCQADFI